jgi:YfiH family protein
MSFTEHEKHDVVWTTADGMPCLHAFSTRLGGVSTGPYATLNLGEHTGDDPAAVRENYRRLLVALGIQREEMVFTRQVHGTALRVVTAADGRKPLEDCPACDGLVTNVRELPLIIFSADCIPVLLCDPGAGITGAVHCGWRSTVGDILGAAVEAMQGLGARPENIRAAIGPGIGACCFETGPEVAEALLSWLPGAEAFIAPLPASAGGLPRQVKTNP